MSTVYVPCCFAAFGCSKVNIYIGNKKQKDHGDELGGAGMGEGNAMRFNFSLVLASHEWRTTWIGAPHPRKQF